MFLRRFTDGKFYSTFMATVFNVRPQINNNVLRIKAETRKNITYLLSVPLM